MKTIRTSLIISLMMTATILTAQDIQPVKLNEPDMSRGTTIMKAFSMRSSVTDVSDQRVSLQDLSDLLYAADGINRPESGKRTAPSAMNSQDIDIYVFLPEGVYLYDPKANILNPVLAGNHLGIIRVRGFDNASLFLLLVSDISRFRAGDETARLGWSYMDGGIVSENIALFCAGAGLATRPRASMPTEELTRLLKLSSSQRLVLNHPVGYPIK